MRAGRAMTLLDAPNHMLITIEFNTAKGVDAHPYQLRVIDTLEATAIAAQVQARYEELTGKSTDDIAAVQAWYRRWATTRAGILFSCDLAFDPLRHALEGGRPISELMERPDFGTDNLGRVLAGMQSFFSNVTVSSGSLTRTAAPSPKRPKGSARTSPKTAGPSKTRRGTSR